MKGELVYRVVLAALGLAFALVRQRYSSQARRSSTPVITLHDERGRLRAIAALSTLGTAVNAAYIVVPTSVRWASLPVPRTARWCAVGLGVTSLIAFVWAHHTLGTAWSGRVQVTEGQPLVVTGPYRWVRHPMYTALMGWSAAASLISANALVGLTSIGAAVVLWLRVPDEERLMLDAFGDEYAAYRARTWRFAPGL